MLIIINIIYYKQGGRKKSTNSRAKSTTKRAEGTRSITRAENTKVQLRESLKNAPGNSEVPIFCFFIEFLVYFIVLL